MMLSQENALELAREFAAREYRDPRWRVLLDRPLDIKECHGGFGSDYLGMGQHYWSVMFQTETPEGEVMDPDHVIVLVDDTTGNAAWFPTM